MVHLRSCLQMIFINLLQNRAQTTVIGVILFVFFVLFFMFPHRPEVHPRLSKSPTSYNGNLQFDCRTINEKYPLPHWAKLVSTNDGFDMYVYQSHDIVSDRIIESGMWEDVYIDLPNKSPVLDIGGHICWWALTWANLGHQVFTFEPLKENTILCMHSICMNDFQDRVRIWNVGLGEEEKQCSLYSDSVNKGNTMTVCSGDESGTMRKCSEDEKGTMRVCIEDENDKEYIKQQEFQIRRLDDLIEDGVFQFIRMDTEGYILPIVNGGKRVLGNAMEGMIKIWNPNDVDNILQMVPWTKLELENGWFAVPKWLWIKYVKEICSEYFWFSGFWGQNQKCF